MKKYNVALGLIMATLLTASMLPIRLSEGQGNNPYNLIGSEIVIWTMCLSSWCAVYYVQLHFHVRKWQQIGLSLVICVFLSILFYYTSNPFFEDYPLFPLRQYHFAFAILRLSMRGLLVGLVVVPIAFLFENEQQRHKAELESERQRIRASEEQNRLLETVVAERTIKLENTLFSLRKSQSELDNQVYLLSRLVASVTHDVSSPLNYVIIIAKKINQLLETGRHEETAQYSEELVKALINMSSFMNNLLEFTKTQIRRESIVLSQVSLPILVNEKIRLFEGMIGKKNNILHVQIDPELTVLTNHNLLAIVLHNLIDNAVRYTNEGVISIKAATIDGRLRFLIENTAQKVPETFLNHSDAPDPLHHRQTIAKPDENQGIGLILVKNISTLLGIHFVAEHKSGKAVAQLMFND